MRLVNSFSVCAFWSGAGASSLAEAPEKTITLLCHYENSLPGLGAQQKSDPPLDPRELSQ